MKGIIEAEYHHPVNNGINHIFICGEDGQTYFGHNTGFTRKSKHYRKGRAVTFEVEDRGMSHPNAVNIDVEVPVSPVTEDELLSIQHLPDGAYIKRIRKTSGKAEGTEVSMIIKDRKMILSCLPEYE